MDDFSFLGTGTAPRQGLPLSVRLIGPDTPWLRVNSVDSSSRLLFARRIFSRILSIHRRNGIGAPETISGMALSRSPGFSQCTHRRTWLRSEERGVGK